MKKKIAVISIEKKANERYVSQLKSFFGDSVIVDGYYLHGEMPDTLNCDLALLTSVDLTTAIKEAIQDITNIAYVTRCLEKSRIKPLKDFKKGTKMLLYDYSVETAKYLASLITEQGINNLKFSLIGNNSSKEELIAAQFSGMEYCVTAGLAEDIPQELKNMRVLDIGWAEIDPKTLMEIAIVLGLINDELERKIYYYAMTRATTSIGLERHIKLSIDEKERLKTTINAFEDAICIYNNSGMVTSYNNAFIKMFDIDITNLDNCPISELNIPKEIIRAVKSSPRLDEEVVKVPESKKIYTVFKNRAEIIGEAEDRIVIVRDVSDIQRKNSRIRKQMNEIGYKAKYSLDDIIGESKAILDLKAKAKKIAGIDATVLITGETGTGKEMLAQSIHNASSRSSMPFVAINCAALTPSLLESELFGYEAGAFTGSNTEGKIGLLETAHKGTIFLDEIGELPLNVQTKLLRFLQEHEIRRVGGNENVPIDVRVIAATNKNLYEECEKKSFREDLFYRLNVLPIETIPLRNRKSDIMLFVNETLKRLNMPNKALTSELVHELENHYWKGNVRELINCVEYMAYLGENLLDSSLLPPNFHQVIDQLSTATILSQQPIQMISKSDADLEKDILKLLSSASSSRTNLTKQLKSDYPTVSEYQVRKALERLKKEENVIYSVGRGGIKITEKGFNSIK